MTGAYLNADHNAITATLNLLRYLQRFIASADCDECVDPLNTGWHGAVRLTKDQARDKLHWLVDVAINRKAGLPDIRGRRDSDDHQTRLKRDHWRLNDIHQRRIHIYQFETPEVRARFSHLLSHYDD